MKKILRQYVFTLAVIFCIMSFFCGIITVKEKTQYNMDMSPYKTVSVIENSDGIVIIAGGNKTLIKREHIEKLGKKAIYGMLGDIFVRAGDIFEKNAS